MTRRDFSRLAAAAAAPAVCAPVLRAQTAAQKGRDIVDRTIRALGGDAFRNLQYRVENGRAYSFYHEQLSGLSTARIYTKYLSPDRSGAARLGSKEPAPLRMVQRQVFGKHLDEAVVFGEKDAYDVTFRGATPIAPDRLAQFRESTLRDIFYILRERLTEPGLIVEAAGSDVVENQSAEKINIVDSEDRGVTVWIASTTFLPIRQRFDRWDPVIGDRRQEVTNYTKYRDSGAGVMLPWATERERDGERIFQMLADHVTVTERVPDNLFELAPGVRILSK